MFYKSTKTYGNERGLSCCFRQWRATHSHCSLLHGYSIGVKLVFRSTTLDERGWVFDFGGLKGFESWLKDMFDHTVLVAKDDPQLDFYLKGKKEGLFDLRIVDRVGCEGFSALIAKTLNDMLTKFKQGEEWVIYNVNKDKQETYTCPIKLNPSLSLESVEVYEHAANSALVSF